MIRIAAIVLALLLLLFFLHAVAAADGSGTCTFSGTVRLDSTQVADGTSVTAIIAGDEYHTDTSTGYGYSTYSLTIRAPDGKNYPDGTKVTFEVNGHPTGQTATFKAGANVRLDLTASTASTLSSSSIAIIAALLLALLAAGAAAYYFLLRRRGLSIMDWLGRRANVPSADALPVVGDSEGQTLSRYVWDNANLAWVENTKPVKVKPQIGQLVMKSVKASVPVAGVGVPRQKAQDKSIRVTAHNGAVTQKQAAPVPGKEAASNDEVLTLCRGNVKLRVNSPSGMGQLHKFSNDLGHLKRTHQIKISNIDFPSSQSICFELFLQRPIPLLKILKALPEVDTVSNGLKNSPESYRARQISSQANTRLVEVKLKA